VQFTVKIVNITTSLCSMSKNNGLPWLIAHISYIPLTVHCLSYCPTFVALLGHRLNLDYSCATSSSAPDTNSRIDSVDSLLGSLSMYDTLSQGHPPSHATKPISRLTLLKTLVRLVFSHFLGILIRLHFFMFYLIL